MNRISIILSVGTQALPYKINQAEAQQFAKRLFADQYKDIDRLLSLFENTNIEERSFAVPLEWFAEEHSFQEKNNLYIETAVRYGCLAVDACLAAPFLKQPVAYEQVDAIFFVSSTGIATPSIEARMINQLPFSAHTKRIPMWGLGCAGGAAGLARAREYCLAYPTANVLVVCLELCSLTFQRQDKSKSNLVGTSLFADGVASALVVGRESALLSYASLSSLPSMVETETTLLADSEDIMGWDVREEGLYVIFSKDIPTILEKWLQPNIAQFLAKNGLQIEDIAHFIAHPGGRKIMEGYRRSLGLAEHKTDIAEQVLREHGNMSSVTILYVLKSFMEQQITAGERGLLTALGPGFTSELALVEWQAR